MKLNWLAASWRKLRRRFGTKATFQMDDASTALLEELHSILDRRTSLDALSSLITTLDNEAPKLAIAEAAIGIDSSALLRIASHRRGEDLIDYLGASHKAPLVLPGQTVQEFWNNELSAVPTVSKILSSSFRRFKDEVDKLDQDFEQLKEKLSSILDEFENKHGHIYSRTTVRKTLSLMKTLDSRARVPFVPRSFFTAVSTQRDSTKTPPGFKDQGDGDFFVWVDLLFGLKQAQNAGDTFSAVILVTNDTKTDWGRTGATHPLLVAEAHALLGVPFETWTLEQFAESVSDSSS